MFAPVYLSNLCLNLITHVIPFTRVYLCLPLFIGLCLTMFTQVYSFLPMFTPFLFVLTCSLMFTHVYICLPMHTLFT